MQPHAQSVIKRFLSTFLIVAGLGLVAVYLILNAGRSDTVAVGRPAPEFTLAALDAGDLSLSDLEGKVVMLNFWATWCGPCRIEMPEMQRIYDRYKDQGFEIVAINLQETEVAVSGFMNQLGLTFPAVFDIHGLVSDQYLVRTLPTSYFIDRSGIVRYQFVGAMPEEAIEVRVRDLL